MAFLNDDVEVRERTQACCGANQSHVGEAVVGRVEVLVTH